MSWANFDDKYPKHPKVITLSDAAFRLHTSGICYCAEFKTDGLIESTVVKLLVPRFRPSSLEELVSRNIWVTRGDVYSIHDYLDWNQSKATVTENLERIKKVRSAAGRKGAQSRWHNG